MIDARRGLHRAVNPALLVFGLLSSACTSNTAKPAANAAASAEPARVTRPAANDPRQLLTHALGTIEDQGSPLLALDTETKAALDKTLSRLSVAEREQVASNVEFARQRPLLHLAAAGVAPVAYEALAANGVAAEEIVRGRLEAQSTSFNGLGAVVTGVVSRAAHRVLRDALASLDSEGELDAGVLVRIVTAAEPLGRNDLAEQALELLLVQHADSIYGYDLVRLYAEDGRVDAARSTLAKLTAKGGRARALAARSELLLAAAELLRGADHAAPNLDAALKRARAELALRQFTRALQTLAPFESKAGTELGFATTWAEASLEGGLCPGLPPKAGVAELCAANWRSAPLIEQIQTRLSRAWLSGSGRDNASIEAYLGLHFVTPLLYGASIASEPGGPTHVATVRDVESLEQELASVRTVSPRFAALQLFTRVLHGAVQADTEAPKRPSNGALDRLIVDTAAMMRGAETDRVAQTATLGVAASLLQERDVTPLLARINPESLTDGDLLALWIKLAAWSAVANQNLDLLEQAKGALAAWLGQSLSTDLEHSKLVLLLAECDAALHPSEGRKWQALNHLGTQLAKSAGSELGGEAHLVEAAALARLGQREDAIHVLDEVLDDDNAVAAMPTKIGLKSVAEGFRLGLRAAAQGSNKSSLERDLNQLIARVRSETPPSANTALWLELWRRSLRLPAKECDALGACSSKLLASAPDLAQKLGGQVTRLFKQGLLPLGGVGLSLDYSFSDGLRPLVSVEPQLFAVGP